MDGSAPVVVALARSIPSPADGVWNLGPVPVRAYALCILLGIVIAVWLGERRWVARGGQRGTVGDVAIWAVPFGIAGGRIYHVLTDWDAYFGAGQDPLRALEIWRGGLGIWGAIALGGVGAWIACRRKGIALPPMADALAPGIVLAQAAGRWGNWFNQELFGRPTDLPWALEIDPEHRPAGYEDVATYHPTFLYESLWCIGVALVVIWADRRFRMGHGRAFALYVALYTLGRGWIEALRIDPTSDVLGLRLNVWTSILVFVGAVVYIVVSARLRPGREEVVEPGAVTEGVGNPDDPAAEDPAFQGDAEPGAAPRGASSDPAQAGARTTSAATTAVAPGGASASKAPHAGKVFAPRRRLGGGKRDDDGRPDPWITGLAEPGQHDEPSAGEPRTTPDEHQADGDRPA